MSPQSARKYLKDNKVKYILAQFVDIHGVYGPSPASRGYGPLGNSLPGQGRGVFAIIG